MVRSNHEAFARGIGGATLAVMLALFLFGFVAFEIFHRGAIAAQTSHPPLGPTLFYLRGIAVPEVTTRQIYRGLIPFVAVGSRKLRGMGFFLALAT